MHGSTMLMVSHNLGCGSSGRGSGLQAPDSPGIEASRSFMLCSIPLANEFVPAMGPTEDFGAL